jgi:NAD(P)-dependent dehydrogenase (short-subunit alcohol dehydrogenase family)
MANVFITGSADGLGQMAAALLIKQGHRVVLHARNEQRGQQAMDKTPGAESVLIADLSGMEETKNLATKANARGRFDAVIHNAAVYNVSSRDRTIDGLPLIFAVNSLAPYILTALMLRPERLIYLSSGMHSQGTSKLDGLIFNKLRVRDGISYSDSKLHNLILCLAVARIWSNVIANAVDPGWVPTKMGGAGAPDNLEKGFQTQAWLAVSNDKEAKMTGRYMHHQKEKEYLAEADKIKVQDNFISRCEQISGVPFRTE